MADEPKNEKPKIMVDDDWKKQAQEEKRRLAEQASPAGEADEGGGAGEPRELPPADFSTLVSFLATQVMMSLGAYQDSQAGRRYVDLAVAKHYIDTLAMLEQKTKGNLNEEETGLLNSVLYQLRMSYVQVAQAVASGPIGPNPQGRPAR
jgi:hypothetical protein